MRTAQRSAVPRTLSMQQWIDDTRRQLDPWVTAWTDAADAVTASWARGMDLGRSHRAGDCGCGHQRGRHEGHQGHHDCGCDPCSCCVDDDSDLVVIVRPGERRIVPLTLHNTWHRERPVKVSVGPFAGCGCGDDPAATVIARVMPGEDLVLAPCSSTTVELVLVIGGHATLALPSHPLGEVVLAQPAADAAATPGKPGSKATTGGRPDPTKPSPDAPGVTCCTTLYSDIVAAGCARSQRLAVVVLPADCGGHELTCGCGCGCGSR